MIYLLAAIVGFGTGWLIGRLSAYLSVRVHNFRIKEIKDELVHSNLDTGSSDTE